MVVGAAFAQPRPPSRSLACHAIRQLLFRRVIVGGASMQQKPELEAQENRDDAPNRSETKVPEMAENMEHTLRRLVSEKNKRRADSPVQYLHK